MAYQNRLVPTLEGQALVATVEGLSVEDLRDLVAGPTTSLPPACFAVSSGGASHAVTLAGGFYRLKRRTKVVGVAGVSAGALVSAALAYGVPAAAVLDLFVELLQGDKILDRRPAHEGGILARGWGVCRWEVLRRAVVDMLGAKTTLGDSPIPIVVVVTDGYFKRPIYLSKRDTPHVLVADALAVSSAVWPLAPMQEIPSHFAAIGNRLCFDGGYTDNFPNHVFDEREEPTIGLRLGGDCPVADRLEDLDDAACAALEALTWAAQTSKTTRADAVVVDVPTAKLGSGFNFNLTPELVRARWTAGEDAIDARFPLTDGARS